MNENDRTFIHAMRDAHKNRGRTVGAKDLKRRKNSRYFWNRGSIVQKFIERFQWADEGCWLWHGATTRGFGYLVWGSRQDHAGKQPRIQAHRLSWLLYRGELKEGDLVGQTCERKLCVNPQHLFTWRR